jgi:hypothetical protein
MHLRTFFQLAYLSGNAMGYPGSWIPYGAFYALLMWARGLVTFLLLRRLLPDYPAFSFYAAGLTLFHTSDPSFLWVGQLNQQGFLFWTVAAIYSLIAAFQHPLPGRRVFWMLAAALFQHMTLWTYESPIVIVCAAPVLLPVLSRNLIRCLRYALGWWIMPAIYLICYAAFRNVGYQSALVRSDWSGLALLSDLGANVRLTFSFWRWGENSTQPQTQWMFTAIAAAAFLIGCALSWRGRTWARAPVRPLIVVVCYGFGASLASFPAYMLLRDAASGWRTQLLSGPGSMLALAAACALPAAFLKNQKAAKLFPLLAAIPIVLGGMRGAHSYSAGHRAAWERQRELAAAIIRAAPRLAPDTILILRGLPKEKDPFGENLWFDEFVRLYNPGTRVAGAYYFPGEARPADNAWQFKYDWWRWHRSNNLFLEATRASNAVLLDYNGGDVRLAADSARQILPGPPHPVALRRYDPFR